MRKKESWPRKGKKGNEFWWQTNRGEKEEEGCPGKKSGEGEMSGEEKKEGPEIGQ